MMGKQDVEELLGTLAASGVVPRMALVGVGGAGCNILSLAHDRETEGIDTVAINTDPRALLAARADAKLLIPRAEGASPEAAQRAAEAQWDQLVAMLNQDLVVVTAGLGGGAGSGVAPLVAQAAAANGGTVVVLALLPFTVEGRRPRAEAALEQLRSSANLVITLDNEALTSASADVDFREALDRVDQLALRVIEGLVLRVQAQIVDVGEPLQDLMAGLNPEDFSLPPDGAVLGDLAGADVAPLAIGQGGLIL